MAGWTVDGQVVPSVQPGLFLFTSTHYSFFYVNQADARARPAANPMTDAEKVVAFDEFTANGGRYTVEGNTITTRAFVAKNPGYMAAWPDNPVEITFRRDGDTLHLTFGSGSVARLVRREGQSPPG